MLLARIEITAGPDRGARTYAEVHLGADESVTYQPVIDPFEPAAASSVPRPAGPVAAAHAVLLAPCQPRVVLGMAHNTGPADRLLPPQAFHKSPHSVVGTGHPIEIEPGLDQVDAEAEVAVVIGSAARHLTPETTLAAVFGYTCANDVTDRAAQASDTRWTEAKSRDTFTPVGPWIRTDLDPSELTILLGDGDETGPPASTAGLARSVIEVLVYVTSVMTLYPGDIVLAGAPGPSFRLHPGRTSTVTVAGIGALTNPVVLVDGRAALPEDSGA